MRGPGKYDELATYVRKQSQAKAAIVIVIAGNRGGGFSVQAEIDVTSMLPALLRGLADDIEGQTCGERRP